MTVFVIIPVHDRLECTLECLGSLRRQECADVTTVVVDDGSTDGTCAGLARLHPEVTVLWGDGDLWWSGAMDRGLEWVLPRAADEDHVLALNNDTVLSPDVVSTLLRLASERPRALLGAVAVDRDHGGRIVDGGVRLDWRTAKARRLAEGLTPAEAVARHGEVAAVSVLSGRCTLIPVRAFRDVGVFDQRRLPHYGADWEFSCRAQRHGYALFMAYSTEVRMRVDTTGVRPSDQRLSWSGFVRAHLDIRSPSDLRYRWNFARLCASRRAFPVFVGADFVRTVGGGLRRQLAARVPLPRR